MWAGELFDKNMLFILITFNKWSLSNIIKAAEG